MPTARRAELVNGLIGAVTGQMRSALAGALAEPGLRKIAEDHFAEMAERLRPVAEHQIPLIMEATAQAYVREFSVAELAKIDAFAQTPAGGHYLSRSSAIMADPGVVAANRAFMAEAAIANRATADNLRKAIADYLNAHPDVAQKLQQQARERQQAQEKRAAPQSAPPKKR